MPTINEWGFTGDVASRINELLQTHPELPFQRAHIEEWGTGRNKRRDLTLLGADGRVVLTGEVKLPDKADGRTPFQQGVIEDAHRKADDAGASYNFTWNVNRFVLWNTFERNKPISERNLAHWDVLSAPIQNSEDLTHPRVQSQIGDFLLKFLEEFAGLLSGERPIAWLPLDDKFIKIYESSLESPVRIALAAITAHYQRSQEFRRKLNEWMRDEQGWALSDKDEDVLRENLERAAKFSCYDIANKIVFYKALRKRFTKLRQLKIARSIITGPNLVAYLRDLFAQGIRITGDYETVFQSTFGDELPFLNDDATDSWRDLSQNTDGFDFTQLTHEIIGLIFERLLSTEERHKYGQHYTRSEVVDLINSFCIRKADARVMDPACGGGTFLVRAYARKQALAGGGLKHRELLSQIYGFDINAYPVHLTTINLATRDLIDEANYPLIARTDFFNVMRADAPFRVPFVAAGQLLTQFGVGNLDAVVGNPPYVRQEKIGEYYGAEYKKGLHALAAREAPGIEFSGRSDILVYFFPHAATFLNEHGYLGLLTSSTWLDTAYGFRLQKYLLDNFEIIAIIESASEPWFTGARVTTAATILRRQADPAKRAANIVHFVKIRRELSEMLPTFSDDESRSRYFDRVRDHIEGLSRDETTDDWRVRCVRQADLLNLGLLNIVLAENDNDDDDDDDYAAVRRDVSSRSEATRNVPEYVGYKWGIFLRAPEIFFALQERAGAALVPLGTIANIKRGVTSGADDFFYPEDITEDEIRRLSVHEFKELYGIRPSETHKVRLVRAGDGSAHLIEARFLEPVVFNLMEIDSVAIRLSNLKRKVIICRYSKTELRKQNTTHILNYIRWGEHEGFDIRPTCATREPWYDLTGGIRGAMFWSKTHQYRHVVASNPESFICNCNLYDVIPKPSTSEDLLCSILNSTFVALSKQFFGRSAGREGALKTEVVDVNMMPVPDPRHATEKLASRLRAALASIRNRDALPLVDVDGTGDDWTGELALTDRQQLDDAVLELLGFSNVRERERARAELYAEITGLYREIRATEKKMQKFRSESARHGRPTPTSIADEIWQELVDKPVARSLADFVHSSAGRETVMIPVGKPKVTGADMFNPHSLQYGNEYIPLGSDERVQYALHLIAAGASGEVSIPTNPTVCDRAAQLYDAHAVALNEQFSAATSAYTNDEHIQARVIKALWKKAEHT
jgi:type I restriction-modification system DNA methylase subunit